MWLSLGEGEGRGGSNRIASFLLVFLLKGSQDAATGIVKACLIKVMKDSLDEIFFISYLLLLGYKGRRLHGTEITTIHSSIKRLKPSYLRNILLQGKNIADYLRSKNSFQHPCRIGTKCCCKYPFVKESKKSFSDRLWWIIKLSLHF